MMNLAPFPFHTAMLRSARGSVQSPDYYQDRGWLFIYAVCLMPKPKLRFDVQ